MSWARLSVFALASALVAGSGCGDDSFFSTDPVRGPAGTAGNACLYADKTTGYPERGCGTGEGNVIDNFEFVGKDASKGGASAPKQTIRLGDFYDPDGTKGNRFLVISVSAFWCAACKLEAGQLPALNIKYRPKGVVFMTNMMQNGSRQPSSDIDLDNWIRTYRSPAWVVRDEVQVLASFFDPGQMPLNMIVDLRTMKIVRVFVGGSLEKIESELDSRL